jgi:CRISPR system Cascade subunit CasD
MSTLLLRLAGPMQSWGTQSRFSVRDTGMEPSKSGVIGLLCAALGRPRDQPVDDLAGLAMAVRVDREGVLKRDYHTAQNVATAGGRIKDCEPSTRYYLSDADFLVGLEGEKGQDEFLNRLSDALAAPEWPVYLGRKSFVPGIPVCLPQGRGLCSGADALTALKNYPWQPWSPRDKRPAKLRLVVECGPDEGEVRDDVPLSFAERAFTIRYVKTEFCDTPPAVDGPEDAACS